MTQQQRHSQQLPQSEVIAVLALKTAVQQIQAQVVGAAAAAATAETAAAAAAAALAVAAAATAVLSQQLCRPFHLRKHLTLLN